MQDCSSCHPEGQASSCPIYWAFPPDKSGNYRFFTSFRMTGSEGLRMTAGVAKRPRYARTNRERG